jgi:transcriptional regulator with XRE-family HTH domain
MRCESQTRRLREALREVTRLRERPLSQLSRALGRAPNYLSKALGSGAQLKVSELFELLWMLGIAPFDFFLHFFPLGGETSIPPGAAEPQVARFPLSEPSTRRRTRDSARAAREEAIKVGMLLREHIRRQGFTQARVAQGLGLSPRALGHALSGSTRLHIAHVCAVLEQLGLSQSRFFTELISLNARGVDPEWSALLDQLELPMESSLFAKVRV